VGGQALTVFGWLSSGPFGTRPGENTPCLIYVDFTNKITVFHDLGLTDLAPLTLVDVLSRDPMVPRLSLSRGSLMALTNRAILVPEALLPDRRDARVRRNWCVPLFHVPSSLDVA
jgi:hypothetical protein